MPLRELRNMLAEVTGLPYDRFKLVYSGAVMKDDSESLASYHLKPNCTITVIGSSEQLQEPGSTSLGPGSRGVPSAKKQAAGPPTQQGTLQAIQAEVDAVRTSLKPSVTIFLSSIQPAVIANPSSTTDPTSEPLLTPTPAPPTTAKAREEHNRLGELLLQALLRLDAIMPESEWADARSARKLAVKEVQGLLDELDDAWRTSPLSHST